MKILIVSPVFWPEAFRVNDLASALIKAGHQVEVLAGMPNYPEGKFHAGYGWRGPFEEWHEGVRILRFLVFPRGKGRAWELILHYGTWLLGACGRLLAGSGADWDVIFVFQTTPVTAALPALLARWLSGAPAAIWVQDLWPEIVRASGLVTHPALIRAMGWLSDGIYRSFDQVVTQSEGFMEALAGRGVPLARLSCIRNWAEDHYGTSDAATPVMAAEPWQGAFVIMFTGNLGRAQGLPTVLAAAERLREDRRIHWVFVGDGTMSVWMRAEVEARELQQTVWLLGRYPLGQMPGLLAKADALLLSLGPGEALGMTVPSKLQSYLASGKPILGSVDGEAARMIMSSGAGWVAAAEDPEGLAGMAARFASLDPSRLRAMGEAGQAYCNRTFNRGTCIAGIERTLVQMRMGAKAAL